MNLIELYTSILKYCGIAVVQDGYMEFTFGTPESKDVTVTGKRLVLPLPTHLKQGSDETIIFHPATEYVNRGETEVVKMIRSTIAVRINMAVMAMVDKLLVILESTELQKQMEPQQRELLAAVSGIKREKTEEGKLRKKAAAFVVKHIDKIDRLFVSIYLKKNGVVNDVKHTRVGVVTFPIFKLIEETTDLTKDEKKILTDLLNFIFEGSREETCTSHNGYSDSQMCPWFDCLLNTAANLTLRIEELLEVYGPLMGELEQNVQDMVVFDHSWIAGMENLPSLRKEILAIPSQMAGEEQAVAAQPAKTTPAPIERDRPVERVEREEPPQQGLAPLPTMRDLIQRRDRRPSGRDADRYQRDDRRDSRYYDDRDRYDDRRYADDRDYREDRRYRDDRDRYDDRRDDRRDDRGGMSSFLAQAGVDPRRATRSLSLNEGRRGDRDFERFLRDLEYDNPIKYQLLESKGLLEDEYERVCGGYGRRYR